MKIKMVMDGMALVPESLKEKKLLYQMVKLRYSETWTKRGVITLNRTKWLVLTTNGNMYIYTSGKVH